MFIKNILSNIWFILWSPIQNTYLYCCLEPREIFLVNFYFPNTFDIFIFLPVLGRVVRNVISRCPTEICLNLGGAMKDHRRASPYTDTIIHLAYIRKGRPIKVFPCWVCRISTPDIVVRVPLFTHDNSTHSCTYI